MISVTQAEQIVLKTARLLASESVSLQEAYGRVLREKIICDRDQPAFNKSTMDGIAVLSRIFEKTKKFHLEGIVPAGHSQTTLKNRNGCYKIMTGAVVPKGCDAVMPIEYVSIKNNEVTVAGIEQLERGWNIRFQGQDCTKGKAVLHPGCLLLPVHISTAASFGQANIRVSVKPKIAIISTGDELVDIGRKNIKPFQVRASNSYALDAALRRTGLCDAKMFHLRDHKKSLLTEIKKILTSFDILVLSGGVSMGDFDYVPQVLKELNVKVLFHKVAQKPGKPFWFGKNKSNQVVFALPGNPVSTQMCAYRYVIPYLKKAAGLEHKACPVVLAEDFYGSTRYRSLTTGSERRTTLSEGAKRLSRRVMEVEVKTTGLPVDGNVSLDRRSLNNIQKGPRACPWGSSSKTDFTAFVPVKVDNQKGMLTAFPVSTGGSGDFGSLTNSDGFIELKAGQHRFLKNAVVPYYSW